MNDQSEPRLVITSERQLHRQISEIMVREEIDFVAQVVISHWHAIGVDALVQRIVEETANEPRGIVVVYPHPKDGFIIDERDFACRDRPGVRFLFFDANAPSERRTLLGRAAAQFEREWSGVLGLRKVAARASKPAKVVRIASVFQPRLRIMELFRDRRVLATYSPKFATIDEGVGAYMSDKRRSLHQGLDASGSRAASSSWIPALTRVYQLLLAPIEKGSETLLASFDREDLTLFRTEQGRLTPNEAVAALYRSAIDQRAEGVPESRGTRRVALLVTQPTSEYGQMARSDALGLVMSVVEVLTARGFEVLLKSHPRESEGKYDELMATFDPAQLQLADGQTPVETWFAMLRPEFVIGFTSTSLPTAQALFNIPAISISDLMLAKSTSEYLQITASDFKTLTSDLCLHAADLEELGSILDSLRVDAGSDARSWS